MKLHLAAIAHNEKELETYVAQLQVQGFEALSGVQKAGDGSFYQAMAKTVRVLPLANPVTTPSVVSQAFPTAP